MRIFNIITLLFCMSFIEQCKVVNNENNRKQLLIGKWVSEKDSLWVMQFDNKNIYQNYNKDIKDTFQYSLKADSHKESMGIVVMENKVLGRLDYVILNLERNFLSLMTDDGKILTFVKR